MAQIGELAILRPEIVAPLTDAMRLVDGNALRTPALEHFLRATEHQPLRRNIEQFVLAAMQSGNAATRFLGIERGVQKSRRGAGRLQRIHLILHQRDQRRHHNREPFAHERRQLIAERFPAAGRHQNQHIPPRQRRINNLLLQRPKRVVAEGGFEEIFEISLGHA